jgi:hypothetical protein
MAILILALVQVRNGATTTARRLRSAAWAFLGAVTIVIGGLSYEVGQMRDHIQNRIENVALRTKVLRERIAANKQAMLSIVQSPERPPLEPVKAVQAEATALADESRALMQENTAIQSDLDTLRHLRDAKESAYLLIVLMLAPILLVQVVNRIRLRRIQIAERDASLRTSDVDAMLPTVLERKREPT